MLKHCRPDNLNQGTPEPITPVLATVSRGVNVPVLREYFLICRVQSHIYGGIAGVATMSPRFEPRTIPMLPRCTTVYCVTRSVKDVPLCHPECQGCATVSPRCVKDVPRCHPGLSRMCHGVTPECQGFDFIECFTTTFLRAHSWLNWVDEDDDEHDEVGLKEKPEDTRYIKKITSK